MSLEIIAENRCFDGRQLRVRHAATATQCDMTFAVFLPPKATTANVPVLYWLSGLTCTDENFTQKAGAQRYAAEAGIAIVAPDTSPRGDDVPDDPEGAYDFGKGAGFYVDATQAPWATHYRMYSYVTDELPNVIASEFPIARERASISGHSMGGHGALTIGLRHPDIYRSVSAFSPIVAPTQVPWGEKALGNYLGADRDAWRAHDACALVEAGKRTGNILIDQGEADDFLTNQLKPELFKNTCAEAGQNLTLRRQPGYDHSYFFIASFIGDHIGYHARALNAG
ncbi:MAG: S-formylglutathione hydrolase [Pseudomonadota bacterium]